MLKSDIETVQTDLSRFSARFCSLPVRLRRTETDLYHLLHHLHWRQHRPRHPAFLPRPPHPTRHSKLRQQWHDRPRERRDG